MTDSQNTENELKTNRGLHDMIIYVPAILLVVFGLFVLVLFATPMAYVQGAEGKMSLGSFYYMYNLALEDKTLQGIITAIIVFAVYAVLFGIVWSITAYTRQFKSKVLLHSENLSGLFNVYDLPNFCNLTASAIYIVLIVLSSILVFIFVKSQLFVFTGSGVVAEGKTVPGAALICILVFSCLFLLLNGICKTVELKAFLKCFVAHKSNNSENAQG